MNDTTRLKCQPVLGWILLLFSGITLPIKRVYYRIFSPSVMGSNPADASLSWTNTTDIPSTFVPVHPTFFRVTLLEAFIPIWEIPVACSAQELRRYSDWSENPSTFATRSIYEPLARYISPYKMDRAFRSGSYVNRAQAKTGTRNISDLSLEVLGLWPNEVDIRLREVWYQEPPPHPIRPPWQDPWQSLCHTPCSAANPWNPPSIRLSYVWLVLVWSPLTAIANEISPPSIVMGSHILTR